MQKVDFLFLRFPHTPHPDSEMKRSQSTSDLYVSSKRIKPKPFPAHIFTNFAREKMREEENYRQMQKELRNKELLKKSKLPPRMRSSAEIQRTLKKNTSKVRLLLEI